MRCRFGRIGSNGNALLPFTCMHHHGDCSLEMKYGFVYVSIKSHIFADISYFSIER